MTRRTDRPCSACTLLGLVALLGCAQEPLSVPYDQLYVPCESDEDCPREAPECYTHRFYTAPVREDVVEFRQCSRPCSTSRQCRDGLINNGDDGDLVVVSGYCGIEDEQGVYDRLAERDDGHCLDGGNSRYAEYPECPTHGTSRVEVFDGYGYGSPCLPPPLEP
jgi:hypothetical protein